jgi:quinate dehydrogenase (quinone)
MDRIAWQKPLGAVEDVYMGGVKVRASIPIGMASLGAAVNTGSGLPFYAGSLDFYLRVWDGDRHGSLEARLPVGSQTAPVSYLPASSGRHFVIVMAGGSREKNEIGDYVIDYVLPERP